MRNKYLITCLFFFVFKANTGFCTKHTVSAGNASFAFSPDNVSAVVGDTIVFALGSIHSALEVSQATYNANGNTALPGGFSVPFGGGQTVLTTAKTYYYVCGNHYYMGMKGTIQVTNPAGINDILSSTAALEVFPNPVSSHVTFRSNLPAGKQAQLKIYDMTGKCAYSKVSVSSSDNLDLSQLSQGIYFVCLKYDDVVLEKKIVVSR